MDELENERRLTRIEERGKSNTHRLDKLEPIVEEIHTMSKTMVELVQEVKHTNETINGLDEKVDRMDARVDEMEKAPAKEYGSMKKAVLDKAIGVVIGLLTTGLIWAAIQVF